MEFLNRCLNCSITFKNPRIVSQRLLDLDISLCELLTTWTSILEISSEHQVCAECIIILQNQALVVEPKRDFGHRSVCLGCGVSVLRARTIPNDQNRPEHSIIRAWVPQIQADLPIFTRVCRSCWRRATRAHEVYLASIEHKPICSLADNFIEVVMYEQYQEVKRKAKNNRLLFQL